MKLGTGDRKQTTMAAVLGVFALGACIFIYEEVFATGSPAPAPSPAPAATSPDPTVPAAMAPSKPATEANAKPARLNAATLDPTLHMEGMLVAESLAYSGVGRNIFSAQSAPPPVAIPKPVAQARINTPPPPPQPTGPPPPPPIDMKLFGVETAADGKRQACLLHDDTVYLASAGDVVLRRYKVLSVDAKSIQVVDMQNNNQQTLPLLTN